MDRAFAGTLLMLGSGLLALRTGLFPRPWAWFNLGLAGVLVIGPIGWAALLLGLPVWVIGTTVCLRSTEIARLKGVPLPRRSPP